MYAVVGCTECSNLWILEGRPETSTCPRCGTRHRTKQLKRFVESEDQNHVRDVRASMLANRQGHGEAFARLDSFAELDEQVDVAVVSDEEHLESAGLNPDDVAAAGERAASGAGHSGSRKERVLAVLEGLDRPTETEVVEAADERGVPPEYTRSALEKLVRGGEVSESGGRYRLL